MWSQYRGAIKHPSTLTRIPNPRSKTWKHPRLITCLCCLYRACVFLFPACSSFTLYSLAKRAPVPSVLATHGKNHHAIPVTCLLLALRSLAAEVALLASRSQQHLLEAGRLSLKHRHQATALAKTQQHHQHTATFNHHLSHSKSTPPIRNSPAAPKSLYSKRITTHQPKLWNHRP